MSSILSTCIHTAVFLFPAHAPNSVNALLLVLQCHLIRLCHWWQCFVIRGRDNTSCKYFSLPSCGSSTQRLVLCSHEVTTDTATPTGAMGAGEWGVGGLRSIRKLIYYWFSKCDCLHKVLWYILRTFYFVDYAVYLHSIAAPKMGWLVSKTLNTDRIVG